jgi:hypothetical protein
MKNFYVFFPSTNIYRMWGGIEKETVERLASELGDYEFVSEEKYLEATKIKMD